MSRGVSIAVLVATVGCSSEAELGRPSLGNVNAADSGAGAGCESLAACAGDERVELDVCKKRGVLDSAKPSAGLYPVCVVDPEGTLYTTHLTGDTTVDSFGWTHSEYGSGLFPSTLSEADVDRCTAAKADLKVPTADGCSRSSTPVIAEESPASECLPVTGCSGGEAVLLSNACLRRGLAGTTRPSAGLYKACLVDPQGELFLVVVAGDAQLASPGWTHSAWGNGNVPSSLNVENERRCEAELAGTGPGTFLKCGTP